MPDSRVVSGRTGWEQSRKISGAGGGGRRAGHLGGHAASPVRVGLLGLRVGRVVFHGLGLVSNPEHRR